MIEQLAPYPVYKDSGVPWLGDVPGHWEVVPLYAIAQLKSITGQADRELLSVYLDQGVIRFSDVSQKRTNVTSEDLSKYQAVDPGDFVLNNQQAWRGSVGVSKYSGIVSPAYLVLSLNKKVDPAYANQLFRDKSMVDQYLICSRGVGTIQRNLYWPILKRVTTPLPPLNDQIHIIRFLGYIDRRIRKYIRAKQKLIKLLEEQKQAIIHTAVTRGLDPHVPLKPSGIDWLGKIPDHWEIVQLRRRWEVVDCKHVTVPFVDKGVPLASVREVQKFDLDLSTSKQTTKDWLAHLIDGQRIPKRGDLIYCRNVSVGACAYVNTDEQFAMGQDVCLIRSQTENGRFLNYFLRSTVMEHQLSLLLVGSTFNRINVSEIKSLTVVVPPRNEQNAIVTALDSTITNFDRPIASANKEMALLREYHARLIADVVTGKLDVRAAAAALPQEPEEYDAPEADDDTVEGAEIEDASDGLDDVEDDM